MPATGTITAFYTFTANTKARASQVNTNFAQFRGHLIPIAVNTQSGLSNTYDLGSAEYRWRKAYLTDGLFFEGATSTANFDIQSVLDTYGSMNVNIGSAVVKRIRSADSYKTTNGSNPGYGGVCFTPTISTFFTFSSGTYQFNNSTMTIATTGKPVEIGMFSAEVGNATTAGNIKTEGDTFTTSDVYLHLVRNGTTIASMPIISDVGNGTVGTSTAHFPCSVVRFFDVDAPATLACNYHLEVYQNRNDSQLTFSGVRLFARELGAD